MDEILERAVKKWSVWNFLHREFNKTYGQIAC